MVNKVSKHCRNALILNTLRQEEGVAVSYSRSGDQAGSEA